MTVLGEVADPDGHRVELTVERWTHVIDAEAGHPEIARHQETVMRAITAPGAVRPGRQPNEIWFFLHGAGPSRWLQVVVAYEQDRGWIVTAFGRRRDP